MGAYDIADLAGVTIGTVRDLDYRARRARREGTARNRRLLPPSEVVDGTRLWVIGEVALWVATRGDHHPPRPERKPRKPRKQLATAGDEEFLGLVRGAVKKHGPAVTLLQVQAFIRAEGIGADITGLRRCSCKHGPSTSVTHSTPPMGCTGRNWNPCALTGSCTPGRSRGHTG